MVVREVEVTMAEFNALRSLETRCIHLDLFLGNGAGLRTVFDEKRWAEGVKEILGDRTPPADGAPTKLKVV